MAASSQSSSSQKEGNQENRSNDWQDEIHDKHKQILPTLPRDKGWNIEYFFQYQGFWFSGNALKIVLAIQADVFKPRPTDIIVATSAKCGSTWLKALTFATANRSVYDFSTHPLLTSTPRDLVPILGRNLLLKEVDVESLPPPRIFASHLAFTLFPKSVTESDCRLVYMCRNPKDVFVSMWHFMGKVRSKNLPPISFDEAFDLFCKGVSPSGPIWDNALSYWKASLEHPDKVLFLTYEDLKRDPIGIVTKLA